MYSGASARVAVILFRADRRMVQARKMMAPMSVTPRIAPTLIPAITPVERLVLEEVAGAGEVSRGVLEGGGELGRAPGVRLPGVEDVVGEA